MCMLSGNSYYSWPLNRCSCPLVSMWDCFRSPNIHHAQVPYVKWHRPMHVASPLHPWASNHRLQTVRVFIEKKICMWVDLHCSNPCSSRVICISLASQHFCSLQNLAYSRYLTNMTTVGCFCIRYNGDSYRPLSLHRRKLSVLITSDPSGSPIEV